jgi:hypothetical protein
MLSRRYSISYRLLKYVIIYKRKQTLLSFAKLLFWICLKYQIILFFVEAFKERAQYIYLNIIYRNLREFQFKKLKFHLYILRFLYKK